MSDELKEIKNELSSKLDSSNIDDLWNVFRDGMHEILNKHAPSKMLKSKDKLLYVTRSIEQLIRKRNRIYARRKNMQRNFEHSTHNYNISDHKYKALKKDIQQKLRNAHWSYVEDIITPLKNENDKSGLKKFWSYIKKMRRDYVGIASLKYNGKMITDPKEKSRCSK